jgi:hypothetical protein
MKKIARCIKIIKMKIDLEIELGESDHKYSKNYKKY